MRVGVIAEQRTRDLRRAVLRPNLPPDAPLPGDTLTAGVHIGAVDGDDLASDTVLGTCFVYPDPCPWLPEAVGAWHLRQMATDPQRRGEGIGAAVLDAAVAHIQAQGAPLVWCHARETAVGFYAQHGFEGHGAIFLDAEHPIPHLRMFRALREPTGRPASSEG